LENDEQHILNDPLNSGVPASWLKRLANYVIDVIVFSIFLSILLMFLAPVFPPAAKFLQSKQGGMGLNNHITFADQLMISCLYGFYMSVLEAILKGKSIGKLLTRTRVVDVNGLPVSARAAFIRGLVRIIPFEQLSAISFPCRPWHDRWSGTMVVDEAS